jgi:hypothetical protein
MHMSEHNILREGKLSDGTVRSLAIRRPDANALQ